MAFDRQNYFQRRSKPKGPRANERINTVINSFKRVKNCIGKSILIIGSEFILAVNKRRVIQSVSSRNRDTNEKTILHSLVAPLARSESGSSNKINLQDGQAIFFC